MRFIIKVEPRYNATQTVSMSMDWHFTYNLCLCRQVLQVLLCYLPMKFKTSWEKKWKNWRHSNEHFQVKKKKVNYEYLQRSKPNITCTCVFKREKGRGEPLNNHRTQNRERERERRERGKREREREGRREKEERSRWLTEEEGQKKERKGGICIRKN